MNDKSSLREAIILRKKSFSIIERERLSAIIIKRLEAHPRFLSSRTILFYYSLPDEVDTHNCIEKWSRQGKRILLPVVVGKNLEIRLYKSPKNLEKGAYHIEEPKGNAFVNYEQIELALIPGISFDKNGNRLGRGKGFYDRLLYRLAPYKIYKMGICFDFQKYNKIPTESHDISMDEVL
ncbi:MAG: 5-formyltetrahydrofolate cyclo-ligase [Bacteroidaceae bacterium]